MTGKITQASKTSARVRHNGGRFDRIDPELVAEELSAQRIATVAELRGGAAALFALREDLARRLVSTGGRPCLEGTARRQKIPLSDEDWTALEKLAKGLSDEELRPTAGQVASVLLHHALADIVDQVGLKTSIKKRAKAARKTG
jgi:hypothetical protein